MISGAGPWLAPGGRLLIETSSHLTGGTLALVAAAGLNPQVLRDEDLDATVVLGHTPRRTEPFMP